MIPQLKAKLEEARQKKLPMSHLSDFDFAVSILMPVIEKLVEQRDDWASSYHKSHPLNRFDSEYLNKRFREHILEENQEILKLLEEI